MDAVDRLAAALGLGDALECWRGELGASDDFPAERFPLPDPGAAAALAERFGFAPDVGDALVGAAHGWREPAAQRLARHAQWRLVEAYDPRRLFDVWPSLDTSPQPAVRLLWAGVGLSLVPHVERLHASRGIPPAVTVATLWDLGQQVHEHRLVHGHYGLGVMGYVRHYLAGHLVGLGRLQYQVTWWPLPDDGPLRHGAPVLDLHIPACGPLDPDAVEASLAQARDFFPRHFPDHAAAFATCESWLLDPQLAAALPASSNIVRFQRRFTVVPIPLPVPSGAFRFVFHLDGVEGADGVVAPEVLDGLPRATTLQRVLADHLRAGGRWHMTAGYFPLPAP